MFWYVVLAVIVVGTALAWWSSGRSKAQGRARREVAQAETDALLGANQRQAGGAWSA